MTYEYQFTDATGGTFEFSQSIKSPALTEHNGRPCKRLISAESGGFRLVAGASGGWASTGYSVPEGHRWAESQLGRKLNKPVG